jgi:predicted TIM-barrel fold metal-dependent hydrolase
MFESNFPVDRVSCSYVVLWNAFKKIAASFTRDEKTQLFQRTASEVYRLTLTSEIPSQAHGDRKG